MVKDGVSYFTFWLVEIVPAVPNEPNKTTNVYQTGVRGGRVRPRPLLDRPRPLLSRLSCYCSLFSTGSFCFSPRLPRVFQCLTHSRDQESTVKHQRGPRAHVNTCMSPLNEHADTCTHSIHLRTAVFRILPAVCGGCLQTDQDKERPGALPVLIGSCLKHFLLNVSRRILCCPLW